MLVSVFASGCASTRPMAAQDLDYFVVDCRIKAQQIAMLQSMRTDPDTRLFNGLSNILQPWRVVTNPNERARANAVYIGQTDWLINQHLMSIARNCR